MHTQTQERGGGDPRSLHRPNIGIFLGLNFTTHGTAHCRAQDCAALRVLSQQHQAFNHQPQQDQHNTLLECLEENCCHMSLEGGLNRASSLSSRVLAHTSITCMY